MKRIYLVIILFLLTSVILFAFGSKEKDIPVVQVTGIVRLAGPTLFPELIITGSDYVWHIAADEIHKLIEMQHSLVILEAEETLIELRFANGMPAGTRRELRNVRIIYIQGTE
jgi:hypothetical protein